jgi:hypothetical protein
MANTYTHTTNAPATNASLSSTEIDLNELLAAANKFRLEQEESERKFNDRQSPCPLCGRKMWIKGTTLHLCFHWASYIRYSIPTAVPQGDRVTESTMPDPLSSVMLVVDG